MSTPTLNDNLSGEDKPSTTLTGTVEKVIKPPHAGLPETAQVRVDQAEDLYREIRIDNTLTDENGEKVGLKPGASVEVTIQADPKDTIKKPA